MNAGPLGGFESVAVHEAGHMIADAALGFTSYGSLEVSADLHCIGGEASFMDSPDEDPFDVPDWVQHLSAIAGGVANVWHLELPMTTANVLLWMSEGDIEIAGTFTQADVDQVFALLQRHADVFAETVETLLRDFEASLEPYMLEVEPFHADHACPIDNAD